MKKICQLNIYKSSLSRGIFNLSKRKKNLEKTTDLSTYLTFNQKTVKTIIEII